MEKLISQLKAQNKLINIVRCQPKISKTALSEYLKVSWPTVSTNIEALKKSGIFDPDEGLAIKMGICLYGRFICRISTN